MFRAIAANIPAAETILGENEKPGALLPGVCINFCISISVILGYAGIQFNIIIRNGKQVVVFRKILLYGWDTFFF